MLSFALLPALLALALSATPICATKSSTPVTLHHFLTAKVAVGKPVGPAPIDGAGNILVGEIIVHPLPAAHPK